MSHPALIVFACFASVLLLYIAHIARKHRQKLKQDSEALQAQLDKQVQSLQAEGVTLDAEALEGRSLKNQLWQSLQQAHQAGFDSNPRKGAAGGRLTALQQADCDALMATLTELAPRCPETEQRWQLYRALLGQAAQLGGFAYWDLRGSEKQARKGREGLEAQRRAMAERLAALTE
ncbi:hypothetical protein [Ferrimonas marina]|uniref:Uncharacterized protein n=1 Tax=Ferrimonas marina TaxID=299255 RepID=A0A1M5X705_9GAMM|nr:hypothetical protein [Ferrimonas marina]SHH95605.1 hypothetical protein SAMN02745129_3287 [Ferrimonas marina]